MSARDSSGSSTTETIGGWVRPGAASVGRLRVFDPWADTITVIGLLDGPGSRAPPMAAREQSERIGLKPWVTEIETVLTGVHNGTRALR